MPPEDYNLPLDKQAETAVDTMRRIEREMRSPLGAIGTGAGAKSVPGVGQAHVGTVGGNVGPLSAIGVVAANPWSGAPAAVVGRGAVNAGPVDVSLQRVQPTMQGARAENIVGVGGRPFDPDTYFGVQAGQGPAGRSYGVNVGRGNLNAYGSYNPERKAANAGLEYRFNFDEGGPVVMPSADPMGGFTGMDGVEQTARAPGMYEALADRVAAVGAPLRRPIDTIGQGAREIPNTIADYARDVTAGPDPSQRLASDIGKAGSAIWEGVKQDPVGTALDVLPVVGEIRSGMDADKYSRMADEAAAAGDEKKASIFRQLAAVAAAGTAPLAGTAARLAKRGAKAGVEAAEAGAKAGVEAVEAGAKEAENVIEKAAIDGAEQTVEAAKFAGKAGSSPEEMSNLLDDVRGTQIGKMVERYNDLPAEEAIQLLYQDLKGLAIEGKIGKEWYERSSSRILDFVGGDKDQADKFAQLIAIYSPQTAVDVNTQNAVKAYNRALSGEKLWDGQIIDMDKTFPTIKAANDYVRSLGGSKEGFTKIPLDDSGKRFLIAQHGSKNAYENIATLDRDLKAHLVMNEDIPFEGRKINNFYNNLMVQIDPSRLQGSTQDLWMARAFGFESDAVGSGAKYDFMERLTADLAQDLGWRPHQVQAAIWTAMKTRQEGVKDAVRAAALEQGIARNVPDPQNPGKMKFEVLEGNEGKFANMVREASLGADITEDAIAAAARDFSDFLDQNLAYVSWEAVPSTKIGHLDGIGDLPPEARAEYHMDMSRALQDDQGRDLLASYLNILSPGGIDAPGYWENVSNPATLTQVGATRIKAAGQQPTIDSASRSAIELYANAMGLLLKQDGVGYHRPYYNPQVTKANGMEYKFEKPLSRDDIMNIGNMLDEKFGGSVALIPVGDNQVRILNFGDAKDQRAFHKAVDQVMQSGMIDNAAGYRVFGSDGDLVSNNWKEKPNGEDYVSRISAAGRPDVLEYLSDFLAPRVEAVDRKFAEQYGLKRNEALEKALLGLKRPVEQKAVGGAVGYAKGGEATSKQGAIQRALIDFRKLAAQHDINKPQLAYMIRQKAPAMPKEQAALYAKNILSENVLDLSARLESNPRALPVLRDLSERVKKDRGDKLMGDLRRVLRDRAIKG
jgi:hypothetical protein